MRNSTGEGGDSHNIIPLWEVKKERLVSMQEKINAIPKLLSESAGHSSCSIFRVPQSLIDANGSVYKPHIVSIGPYHHGEPQLQMIEEHKWRLLGVLSNRTQAELGLSLEDYLKAVQPLEGKARECYSENICFDTDEFIEMLVLDGCFIIELFRRFGRVVPVDPDDPLVSMSWVLSFFLRDLIGVENQIPFFVLQKLFEITRMPGEESGPSFSQLALVFFNYGFQRSEEVVERYKICEGKHLLDLLRSTFIPPDQDKPRDRKFAPTHVIQCISKLRHAGIKLKPGQAETFLVVKFQHGVIQMPTISIDDFMSCFMANCVAFEQCHKYCTKHFTTYATLLDCLINTSKDVEYLSDQNIIENYLGTDAEVAKFIINLGKDVTFDIEKCYLTNLFIEVNEHYKNNLYVQWASFKNTYFSSPWSFISALAAFILLVLSVLQTYYTMKPFFDGSGG